MSFVHISAHTHRGSLIECAQAVCSHNADLTATQWLLLLALLGRNNALLLTPLAGWKCLHIEGGGVR